MSFSSPVPTAPPNPSGNSQKRGNEWVFPLNPPKPSRVKGGGTVSPFFLRVQCPQLVNILPLLSAGLEVIPAVYSFLLAFTMNLRKDVAT
ncbi:hypothetical protein CEXT_237131 [Caerostris extrusa]|uniref:Uncharacterized protein n=1 Tax=Caerostris extrusa TaxID=172846 RepID=A0AAV4U124_CAEEX|nr:hypothetical protein CEXT_237131 [Caerostris extrusa]